MGSKGKSQKGRGRIPDLRQHAAGHVRDFEEEVTMATIRRFTVGKAVEVLMLSSWVRTTVIKNDGQTVTVSVGGVCIYVHKSVLAKNLRTI